MSDTVETLLGKKLERYTWKSSDITDNFKEDKELTVEITLAEYRQLISDNAKSSYKLDKLEEEKREVEKNCLDLKKQIDKLNDIIATLREVPCHIADEGTSDE